MAEIKFRSDITAELIDSMGDEQSIIRAARVSTMGAKAEAKEAEGLLRFLVRERHHVPLEACVMTFRLEVPVFVSRQLVKHRITSISEESGRYRELDPTFYIPDDSRRTKQVGKTGNYEFVDDDFGNSYAQDMIAFASDVAYRAYSDMLKEGIAKEVARMVLPVNVYSTMYLTVNLRSALNIISLRTGRYGSHPQHEIALVGEAIRDILIDKFPVVVDEYEKGWKA